MGSLSTLSSARQQGIEVAALAGLPVLLLLGVLLVAFPLAVFGFVAALASFALLALVLVRTTGLALWKVLVLTALTGYIVLNYGFANLAFRVGGIPFIAGHMLMFAAFGLAVVTAKNLRLKILSEPALLVFSALIVLSAVHLVFDVRRYGLYAVRDSSVFVEGIFLLLGLLWATDKHNTIALLKWLMPLFIVNWLYAMTLPWGETVKAWSPQSGIFLSVPVFGSYNGNALYLLAGGLFCIWLGSQVVRWPRWILLLLALGQFFALTIRQRRSSYVGLLAVFLLLPLLGEFRKWAKLVVVVGLVGGMLLTLTSLMGIELPGRRGPVSVSFLVEQSRSLLLERGTPGVGGVYERLEWYADVWKRARSSTGNLVFGEGFGKPLISFHDQEGVTVRQPHNTHLSVLARLGLVGAVGWVLFHLSILHRFLYVFRRRRYLRKESSDLALWLFLFYILAMILTSVQPYLEFSYGAIPFYFLIGFALGFMRWQLRQEFAETISARENLAFYPARRFLSLRPVASGAGVAHARSGLD